jgi:hypothetical protein
MALAIASNADCGIRKRSIGGLLPPSPPPEQATDRQDQTRQTRIDVWDGHKRESSAKGSGAFMNRDGPAIAG